MERHLVLVCPSWSMTVASLCNWNELRFDGRINYAKQTICAHALLCHKHISNNSIVFQWNWDPAA
jgi:hypothetical protein